MIEKILKSTFQPTIKQLKKIRSPFFSNETLERYGDSFISSYKLEIYSKEIKEYVRIKNREEKVIVTACEEDIKELFGKKVMEFFHIIFAEKLETELSTREYFKKILHKNEKITFHQDDFNYRFKDNENNFGCKIAWAEYRHYQLGAFYIKKNQPYEKEYEQLRNQYKNETLESLEKFKKIESLVYLRTFIL